MTELTIRRIAMGLIADNTCYIDDNGTDERTIMLGYVMGIVTMANEMIAVCGKEGDTE